LCNTGTSEGDYSMKNFSVLGLMRENGTMPSPAMWLTSPLDVCFFRFATAWNESDIYVSSRSDQRGKEMRQKPSFGDKKSSWTDRFGAFPLRKSLYRVAAKALSRCVRTSFAVPLRLYRNAIKALSQSSQIFVRRQMLRKVLKISLLWKIRKNRVFSAER
jgi:hypothetical protein